MSDPYFNRSRQGKIQQLGYDEIISNPSDTRSCSICLQRNEAEAVLAALEPIGWASRWYSSSDADIDKDLVEAFVAGIRNKIMSDCCGDQTPDIIRIGDDGTLEGSNDGGLTWIDVPTADDFRFTGTLYPALSDDITDKKCQGAGQTVDMFKQVQSDFSTTLSSGLPWAILIASIATGLLFWFALPVLGTIAIMIASMLGLLLTMTDTEFDALFTTDVWDEWLCLVYCNIGAAAAWDETQLTNLLGSLEESEIITGAARTFFNVITRVWWVVGMTNAARTVRDTTYDCSACDCGSCPEWELFNFGFAPGGNIISRVGNVLTVESTTLGDGLHYIQIATVDEGCCTVEDWEFSVGTAPGPTRIICPAARDVGSISYGPLDNTIGQVSYIGFGGASSPFTLVITFA